MRSEEPVAFWLIVKLVAQVSQLANLLAPSGASTSLKIEFIKFNAQKMTPPLALAFGCETTKYTRESLAATRNRLALAHIHRMILSTHNGESELFIQV